MGEQSRGADPVQKRRREFGRWAAASALVAAVGFYYRVTWGDLSGFVGAIDAIPVLFADFFLHFLPAGQQMLAEHRPGPLFVYSPTFALSLAPLTAVPTELEAFACGAFEISASLALLAVSLWILRSDHPAFGPLCVVGFITSFPILHNFGWGQVSVPLTLCVLLGYTCHDRGWIAAAAGLLAYAIAIKYYVAIFLVYFLFRRDLPFLAWCLAASVLLMVALPAAVMGLETTLEYYETTSHTLSLLGPRISRDLNSQYLPHLATRLFRAAPAERDWIFEAARLLGYGVVASNLAILWIGIRRALPGAGTLSFVVLSLSIPFFAPTSWPHYFSYLPFCQGFLALSVPREPTAGRRVVLASTVLLSVLLSNVIFFNLWGDWRAYAAGGTLFVSNFLLLIGVYATVLPQLAGSSGRPPTTNQEAR